LLFFSILPADFAIGGLTSLRDIIEYTPGVIYDGGATPIGNTISMRGVSTLVSAPTVGIYIDDVPIGSRNNFGLASIKWRAISMFMQFDFQTA